MTAEDQAQADLAKALRARAEQVEQALDTLLPEVEGAEARLAEFRPDLLIPKQKRFFQGKRRLVLAGEKDWGKNIPAPKGGSHTVEMHELLKAEGIPHLYDHSLAVPHRWDAAWMEPVLKELIEIADEGK